MLGEPLNLRPLDVPVHAMPEVVGPNSVPTGTRFDTSTDFYAVRWPPTPTVTESAIRARARLSEQAGIIIQKVMTATEEPSSYYET